VQGAGDTVGNCLQVSNGSRIELQGLLVRFPLLRYKSLSLATIFTRNSLQTLLGPAANLQHPQPPAADPL
jgi:hypothetical protein